MSGAMFRDGYSLFRGGWWRAICLGWAVCCFWVVGISQLWAAVEKKPKGGEVAILPTHRLELGGGLELGRGREGWGGSLSVGYQYRLLAQIRLGAWGGWMGGVEQQRVRASVGMHILLDTLPVMPYLQVGMGVMLQISERDLRWTPIVHLAVGLEIPLSRAWRLGFAYHQILPTDETSLAVSHSLHLHTTLVW